MWRPSIKSCRSTETTRRLRQCVTTVDRDNLGEHALRNDITHRRNAALSRAKAILAACCLLPSLCSGLHAHPGHDHKRQIVAHRGSSADRPENTLASCKRAIEAGATAVEVDVRMTKDRRLVVMHDAKLDRTTDGQGLVAETTLAEIKKLDAGSWFHPKYRNQRVPTLAEVFDTCRNRADVVLDLKVDDAQFFEAVVRHVRAKTRPRQVIVIVNNVAQARYFRRQLPMCRQLGLLAGPDDIGPMAAAGVDVLRLRPPWMEDIEVVHALLKTRAKLHLIDRTGKPEGILPLLVRQPFSLSTDDPARLIKVLADYKAGKLTPARKRPSSR